MKPVDILLVCLSPSPPPLLLTILLLSLHLLRQGAEEEGGATDEEEKQRVFRPSVSLSSRVGGPKDVTEMAEADWLTGETGRRLDDQALFLQATVGGVRGPLRPIRRLSPSSRPRSDLGFETMKVS